MFKKSLSIDARNILILILFAIIIQLILLTPPYLSDQMEYYFTATKFPHLQSPPNHWGMRIGLILPVAVIFRIFGHAEITFYFIPLISILILVAAVYYLGSGIANKRVGMVSALWISMAPGLLFQSMQLLPDIPATACIVVGFALIASIEKIKGHRDKDGNQRNIFLLYLLVGLVFGYAYLIKEYFLIFIVLIPIGFWAFNISLRNLVPVAVGVLLIFFAEAVFNIIFYHDPLVRLSTANPREIVGFIERQLKDILMYLPNFLMMKGGEGTLILSVFALIHFIIQSIKNNRRIIFLFVWVLFIFFFLISISLLPVIFSWENSILLRLHILRYWVLILPPFIIGGVSALQAMLTWIVNKTKVTQELQRTIVLISMFVLAIISGARGFSVVFTDESLIRNGQDHYLELREYLKKTSSPEEVIWINRDNFIAYDRLLPIYAHDFFGRKIWEGQYKYLNFGNEYISPEEITYGKVIIDRERFNPAFRGLPEYLSEIPDNWELDFESTNHKIAIYQVQ